MSKRYEGIFLFDEWLTALNQLPAKTAMSIIIGIYRYNLEGVEPPPQKGNAALVQSIMLAHEKRANSASGRGRVGAESRWQAKGDGKNSLSDNGNQTPSVPSSVPASAARSGNIPAHWLIESQAELSEEDKEWDAKRVDLLIRARSKRDAAEAAKAAKAALSHGG